MPFDQINQALISFTFGNVALDTVLADEQIHLSGACAYVAEICISHLTRAVDNTTHNRNFYTFEVVGFAFYALRGRLQVE